MNDSAPLTPTGAPNGLVAIIAAALLVWAGSYFLTQRDVAVPEGREVAGAQTAPEPTRPEPPAFPTELLEKIRQHDAPLLDLQARMWAHSVGSGQVSLETLESYSRDWIMDGSHREELFIRIRRNLAIGNTAPLTDEERARVEAAAAETRRILEKYRAQAVNDAARKGAQ